MSEVNGCPNSLYIYSYFYLFTMVVAFVMINLFVGVIVDAYHSADTKCILEVAETKMFFERWVDYRWNPDMDPDAMDIPVMKVKHLERFFASINKPLGFRDTNHGKRRQTVRDSIYNHLSNEYTYAHAHKHINHRKQLFL